MFLIILLLVIDWGDSSFLFDNEISGDTVTKVLHRLCPTIPYLFQNRYFIIFLCSCFVTLPLSFYRNIAKLSQISLIGLVLVLITVLILIKRGYDTLSFM